MNTLVTDQVTLLDERATAHVTDVGANAHVRAHVTGQLTALRRRVAAVVELALEHITCRRH